MNPRYLLGFLLVCLGFSSCQQEEKKKTYLVGFSQCCEDPWRDVMNGEIRRELTLHPELRLEVRRADNVSETQVEQIRELVALGIDILLVSPNESKPLTPVIEEVYNKGIPVILMDRKTDSKLYSAYIGADNYQIGKTAALYLASKLNGQGKIVEILLPRLISPSIERNRGFREGLALSPDLQVISEFETYEGPASVEMLLPSVLDDNPDANVIFAHTDLLAETAYKVAQQKGKEEDILFIGIDGIPGLGKGIQAVEDGILDASMLYPTGGREAIRLTVSILNNLPFEKENTLETIVIDDVNARILHNQMKKVNSLQGNIDEQLQVLEASKLIAKNQRTFIFILVFSLLLAIVLGLSLFKSLRRNKASLKNLEEKNRKISENEQELLQMSEEVKMATQAKVDFFTNISHEFRTPLTLILGFTEDLLPGQGLKTEVQQSIKLIRQNAKRLYRLVNQLMDFRKVEEDKMTLNVSENDIVVFIKDAMASYVSVAEKRDIQFELLTKQSSINVWFDPHMLDKVVFNLLSNAFKFTPNGGKILLMLQVRHKEDEVELIIEDNGKGMTEEERLHIFEPFYQGKNSGTIGTGLGLPLSKRLIEAHKGKVYVSSQPNNYTRFVVTLPLGNAHLNEELLGTQLFSKGRDKDIIGLNDYSESEKMTESVQLPEVGNFSILLIEDNEELQFFLQKSLGKSYSISATTNGSEGISLAVDILPDIVICDIQLPGMNGLEITRQLKQDIRTSHIPILLLTSQGSLEQQIEGIEVGADAYVTKPFNIQLLKAQLANLVQNRSLLKNSYQSHITQVAIDNNLQPIDQQFLQHLQSFIENNYDRQDFAVGDLCIEFGLSRSQLYRKVKALLGQSITDYIQELRLQKAEILLREEKTPISEIAYLIGYSSPDYFSTVFKNRYNMTPSQFRKNPS